MHNIVNATIYHSESLSESSRHYHISSSDEGLEYSYKACFVD